VYIEKYNVFGIKNKIDKSESPTCELDIRFTANWNYVFNMIKVFNILNFEYEATSLEDSKLSLSEKPQEIAQSHIAIKEANIYTDFQDLKYQRDIKEKILAFPRLIHEFLRKISNRIFFSRIKSYIQLSLKHLNN